MRKDYFNKLEFKKAIEIIEVNPLESKLRFEEYINKYPEDYYAYVYYIGTLITLKEFDQAENMFNELNIKFKRNGHFCNQTEKLKLLKQNISFVKLRLLVNQGRYEEAINLINEPFQFSNDIDLNSVIYYCNKKLRQTKSRNRESHSYLIRQITEYKESDFKDHIKKHSDDFNINAENPNESIFNPNFPIKNIIEEIKKYISSSDKKICPGFYEDVYIFKYDECGRDNGKLVDYFKVVCFNNTQEFITMYPVDKCENLPTIDINYLNTNNKQKVKRMSQIERFNKKYKLD